MTSYDDENDTVPVTIYFSENARFLYIVNSEKSQIPDWYFKGIPHLQSQYSVRLGMSKPCNGRLSQVLGRNFKVAGCVVCQDSEGRYLITRRSSRMSFWPSAWVYPGGHIEVGEGLDEGSLRELHEETGVKVSVQKLSGQARRKYTYAG